ncbi:nucleotidyltransferase family protein [Nocardioides sp.]|uniref:nucleotidyltransferase family protein n=1 Tax=Nocardioides sp. TaxID=35761 RepID=UPI002C4EB7BA|nr:nucleotidyltransferase domain-containing protein [Nocardioides sp.]HVX55469.1 nucleotidyltransferase domain-containing protein [Nocardioides sp.]
MNGLAVDVARLREVCERYGVVRLEVFGSVSRGEDRPDSDVDLRDELQPGSRLGFDYFDLVDDLAELFGRAVDLATRQPRPGFRLNRRRGPPPSLSSPFRRRRPSHMAAQTSHWHISLVSEPARHAARHVDAGPRRCPPYPTRRTTPSNPRGTASVVLDGDISAPSLRS